LSDLEFTEGNTCGCTKWCNQRGEKYGVCGDGHTCICKMEPITKDNIGKNDSNMMKKYLMRILIFNSRS
jgi:hypothetical protein